MTDDTDLNWNARWIKLRAWAVAHPTHCFVALGMLVAFLMGAVMF